MHHVWMLSRVEKAASAVLRETVLTCTASGGLLNYFVLSGSSRDVLVKSMSLACLSWDFYFLWGTFIFISPLRNRLKLFPSDVVCLFVCVFFETGSHSGAHDGLELTTLLLWPLEHRIAGLCHHGWLCLTLAAWMSDYLERYAGVFLSLYK